MATNATYTSPDWGYYKYPLSISQIPDPMRRGMIVLCAITFVSCITTLSLIGYLSYRFFTGRNEHGTPLHKNQYMLLIYSLVLADLQLDLGFLLDILWLDEGQILAPSAACMAQGWLLNVGDLASGLFVFAIACHTFFTVVYGRKIGLRTVCWSIVSLWVLSAVLTIIPIAMHPGDIFVAQGNWCSINGKYNSLRLWFHYIWDFMAEFAILVMYLTAFFVVRRRMGSILPDLVHPNAATLENGDTNNSRSTRARGISRATMYMILYPLIYIISTLPLGAGRISSMVGNRPSTTYLVIAGCLMACGGWMNCLVYSLTRRLFHKSKLRPDQDSRRTPYGGGKDSTSGAVMEMSISGSQTPAGYRELVGSIGSRDNIAAGKARNSATNSETNEGVTMEMTWEVKTEEVKPDATLSNIYGLGHHSSVCRLPLGRGEIPRGRDRHNMKIKSSEI